MSQVCISYGSLKDASSEAGQVAKKLNTYADHLDSQVYRKLNSYSGSYTENIAQAKSNISSKISDLRNRANAYSTYSNDLADLKDQCDSTDKAVRSSVSKLTAKFKSANGIRDSKVQNSINYLLTRIGNKTSAGRWIGNKKDEFKGKVSSLKESIKTWYQYEGGKELIKGVLVGALDIAIGLLTIAGVVISVLSGAFTIFLVFEFIGGAILAANGLANIINESRAYKATQEGDPATGRRRSDINSWQDYLRSSYFITDGGDEYDKNYNPIWEQLATGIDIVNFACGVASFVNNLGGIIKNGYKWATGSAAKVDSITIRQIFSKDAFRAYKGKFADINATFKTRGFDAVKDFSGRISNDFGRNFKKQFFDFKKINGQVNWKGATSSIKNMLAIPKDFLNKGFSISSIADITFNRIVLPSTTAFTVNSTNATMVRGRDGQMRLDFTEKITLNKITDIGVKFYKGTGEIKQLFSSNTVLEKNLIGKLSSACDINISVPEIYIPNIEMPVLRAA